MPFGFMTTDQVDWNELWYGAILPATQMYNEDPVDFERLLTAPIDEQYIKLFHRGTAKYQPMSDLSVPTNQDIAKGRIRPEPKFWGIGTGYTWKFLVENTSAEVMETNSQLQMTDREFVRKQSLAPLLVAPGTNSEKWGMWDGNFKSEEGITTPPTFGVHTFTAAHTHYVGTGIPVESGIQLEDLNAAKFHIREHGHYGELTGWFSDKQVNQLELLALPIWDPGRRAGGIVTPTDTNISKFENSLSSEVLRSGIRGSLLGVNIVETAYMPDDYFVIAETGGANKVMFKQEKANPSTKGLIMFPGESNAYPIINSKQFRWHKFGVRFRSSAVAYQIGVPAGSYTTPTAYDPTNDESVDY